MSVNINNTYVLEKKLNWKGIMIEYHKKWLNEYKIHRPDSIHIIENAANIDYKKLFQDNNVPYNIDYLQIDLEADNGSTLNALKKLQKDVMDKYKSAKITLNMIFIELIVLIQDMNQGKFLKIMVIYVYLVMLIIVVKIPTKIGMFIQIW